jgi:hypothetical protein
MKATAKSQINIKSLTENDEIVTYSDPHGLAQCIKMRIIDGNRVFIIDSNVNGFNSRNFTTLKDAKLSIGFCNHW